MKRKLLAILSVLMMVAMLLTLAGCNKKEEAATTPAEETTVKAVDSPYELDMKNFESFIKSLPDGGYYGFAAMDKDHDALLVTDTVYKEGDKTYALAATVYGYDKNGKVVEYGDVISSKGYPLATKDDHLYFGDNESMTKVTIEEYRNAMTIIDRQKKSEAPAKLEALLSEYQAATPVEFKAVEGSEIPGPMAYAGTWAEKTSERVVIAIEPTLEKGWFDVTITWKEALPQKDLYTMRAHYQKDGTLFYDNCRYLVPTVDDNAQFPDEVKYTNGSGILKLNKKDNTLAWTDYKESPGSNTQFFIKADNIKIETVTAKSTTKTTTKTTKKAETTKSTKKAETTKSTKKAQTTTQDDGQNPVMNYIGRYGSGRATIDVECQGKRDAHFHVYWSSSAAEHSEWTMSGTFDEDTQTVKYTNCVKRTIVYDENGNIEMDAIEYTGGKGVISFRNNSLTWNDSQEHIADGMTFTY